MSARATRPRIAYCAFPLDRASHLRRDAALLAAAERAPSTRVVPVWRNRNLIVPGETPAMVALSGEAARAALAAARETVFLGTDNQGAWFAADLSEHADADLAAILAGAPGGVGRPTDGPGAGKAAGSLNSGAGAPGGVGRPTDRPGAGKAAGSLNSGAGAPGGVGRPTDRPGAGKAAGSLNSGAGAPGGAAFQELRAVGALMAGGEAALLACARGLIHWHGQSRFCGACGAPTKSRDGGHARRCGDAACGRDHFPRTDPAVIMLLTRPGPDGRPDEARCLLARQRHWPDGMYSALAGFVEPGEGLEAAVAREAMEEVGLTLATVSYRASQPWPFPASLMLGFRAEAADDDIRCDEEEIADARWFTRAELKTLPRSDLRLSRPDSIAHFLIEEWLTEED
jgi:NADH pyrophosphatase NudC (nudix superfamily)